MRFCLSPKRDKQCCDATKLHCVQCTSTVSTDELCSVTASFGAFLETHKHQNPTGLKRLFVLCLSADGSACQYSVLPVTTVYIYIDHFMSYIMYSQIRIHFGGRKHVYLVTPSHGSFDISVLEYYY